jgi:RecA-family ATPase
MIDDATIPAAVAVVRQNDARRATTQPEPLRTLNEWLNDPESLIPPKMIVPYLVLEGRVTLLAAREKAGKSTLLGQAVATLSSGGEFLGQVCGPARVLWYAIDEAPADAVRRLVACNADGETVTSVVKAGVNGYVVKPVSLEALKQRVVHILGPLT